MAAALQKEEEERAVERLELEQRSWYKSISEREEVLSAIVVCIITSLILIALVVTGNSALVCFILSYHMICTTISHL